MLTQMKINLEISYEKCSLSQVNGKKFNVYEKCFHVV